MQKRKSGAGLLKTTIYLGRPSPGASSTQPERTAGHRMAFLFALASDGVCQAAPLPTRWCALTAPFQLFRRGRSLLFCGTGPSGRPARPLAGILPCEARTFLVPLARPAVVRPAPRGYSSKKSGGGGPRCDPRGATRMARPAKTRIFRICIPIDSRTKGTPWAPVQS